MEHKCSGEGVKVLFHLRLVHEGAFNASILLGIHDEAAVDRDLRKLLHVRVGVGGTLQVHLRPDAATRLQVAHVELAAKFRHEVEPSGVLERPRVDHLLRRHHLKFVLLHESEEGFAAGTHLLVLRHLRTFALDPLAHPLMDERTDACTFVHFVAVRVLGTLGKATDVHFVVSGTWLQVLREVLSGFLRSPADECGLVDDPKHRTHTVNGSSAHDVLMLVIVELHLDVTFVEANLLHGSLRC